MALAQLEVYTEEDYYTLPEDVRAELIGGQIYYMAAPGRIHQEILSFLHVRIANYINSRKGSCRIYPSADAGVREYWIVDPRSKKIFIYHLEKPDLEVKSCTFEENVTANVFNDLWIDFSELDIS